MAEAKHSIVTVVFSTLSGVGKTMVATNLAAGFARDGYRTCIIDLDLQFGDVANYLDLPENCHTIADAKEALAKGNREDIEKCLSKYYRKGTCFSVLPAPRDMMETYYIEPGDVIEIVTALEEYDYIILDTAATFSQINLEVLDLATFILFVGRVDFIPSIKNFKAGYDLLLRFNYAANKVRLLENFAGKPKVVVMKDVEKLLGRSFSAAIPYDEHVRESLLSGEPMVLEPEKSTAGKALWDVVGYYTDRPPEADAKDEQEKLGMFARLKGLWT